MSEDKVKEIQEFVDEFQNKLKHSFKLFEYRKKQKEKSLKKHFSQIYNENKIRDKFQSFTTKNEINKDIFNNSQLNNKSYAWRPPKGASDYFEKFKYLAHKYELNNWEKVRRYIFL
jgi:hypothetical protein